MSSGCSEAFNELNFLDDNELVSAFQSGRDTSRGRNAVTVLITRYLNLVRKKASLYSGGAEFDDLAHAAVMTMRYCLRRELGRCLLTEAGREWPEPLTLIGAPRPLTLRFDCARCLMQVL